MKAKGYSVRKGEYNQNASRQPYPGVIIEEMLDSVSVHSHGVEHENYPVALIGEHHDDMKPKEPDVSIFNNYFLHFLIKKSWFACLFFSSEMCKLTFEAKKFQCIRT